MKPFLIIGGFTVAVGLWFTLVFFTAKGIALLAKHYGEMWMLVPLFIGAILVTAAVVSSNPIITGK